MEIEGTTPEGAKVLRPDMPAVVTNLKASLERQLTEVRALLYEYHMRDTSLVNQLQALELLEQIHLKANEAQTKAPVQTESPESGIQKRRTFEKK